MLEESKQKKAEYEQRNEEMENEIDRLKEEISNQYSVDRFKDLQFGL